MTVAIVVDPGYPYLKELSEEMPVWAVNSPANRATAEELWKFAESPNAFRGLTVFDINDTTAAEKNCLNILDMVDLHHGELSSGSKIGALRVVGTKLTDKLREELQTYGFANFQPTKDGFVASL